MEFFKCFKDEFGLMWPILCSQMVLLKVKTVILEMDDFELVLELVEM